MSGPFSVIATVCSQCADNLRSAVPHRPAVRVYRGGVVTQQEHRLDGDGHTWPQHVTATGLAMIQDGRFLMHLAADAVPAVFAHHLVAVRAGVTLDHGANVTKRIAGAGECYREIQGLARDLHQAERRRVHVADGDGDGRIAVPTVNDRAKVNTEQIARLQHAVSARNTVNDLVVDAGADARREAVIALERRRGAGLARVMVSAI